METEIWAIGLVIIATIIAAFGSFYLKKASTHFKLTLKSLLHNHLIAGAILYLSSTVFFIIALKGGNVNTLYPITSLTYIWVSLISIKLLNEKINYNKWLGITLIIIGVILMTI